MKLRSIPIKKIFYLLLAFLINLPDGYAENSIEYLRKIAEAGNAEAQYKLGRAYDQGDGIPKDLKEAIKWYRKAAELNNPEAQNCLGWAYTNGEGVAKNYFEAAKWYHAAAEQNNVKAQFNLGRAYAKGEGVPKNFAEAANWYLKAAKQGDIDAQKYLADAYAFGIGVVKNNFEAVKWYRAAAEQGDAEAQNNLGIAYANGIGTNKNLVEAFKWYEKAALKNFSKSQYNLAVCYSIGDGVQVNHTEAFKWFYRAANQGHRDAQFSLGNMYDTGEGGIKNLREAVYWYQKAAKQGHAGAQNNLGCAYNSGEGIIKDDVEALSWFYVAEENGSSDAMKNRKILEAKLGDSQIKLAIVRKKLITEDTNNLNENIKIGANSIENERILSLNFPKQKLAIFGGVSWGDSPEAVKSEVGDIQLTKLSSNERPFSAPDWPEIKVYEAINRENDFLSRFFFFVNDKLYIVQIKLSHNNIPEGNTIERLIIEKMDEKYGKARTNHEFYSIDLPIKTYYWWNSEHSEIRGFKYTTLQFRKFELTYAQPTVSKEIYDIIINETRNSRQIQKNEIKVY